MMHRLAAHRTARRALPALVAAALIAALPSAAPLADAADDGNKRFLQQFFTDAAIANQWFEGQLRILRGAVPPVQDADGFMLGPVIAVSPLKDLEVGGQVFFIDYDPDASGFDSESGAGDVQVFGKYRVMTDPVHLTFGASLSLPTGSEDDGLGTGELVPAVFGAVRGMLGDAVGVAHVGFRFNKDADLFDDRIRLDAKTSTFLGAGLIFPVNDELDWTVEATVESKRFKDRLRGSSSPGPEFDSDIRVTGGVHWSFGRNNHLRGGVGIGLADGAPDVELIGSYVYAF